MWSFSTTLLFLLLFGLPLVFPSPLSAAGPSKQTLVSRISIAKGEPLELDVQTSGPVSPQSQVISNPERLVIDIPESLPSSTLHNLAVNRAAVKQVRVSLFSTSPSVTRIVLDLKELQPYQITPDGSGFRITLGAGSQTLAPEVSGGQTVGWVTSQPRIAATRRSAPIVKAPTRTAQPALVNGVRVQFSNGLLSIHSTGATLSEVLFQIQKQTGADIAIPAGTEQEIVASDFGPGPPSEVLRELLDGSGLNFVVVGTEADPTRPRSVILSRKTEEVTPPQAYAPASAPPAANPPDLAPPVPENPSPAPDSAPPIVDENVPQPQPPLG